MEGRTDSPGPNESFDALIELLGSDDVVQDRRFNNRFDDGLRDADGKLNFGKMHSFFSGRQDDGDHQAPVSYGDTFARPSEPGISNEHPDHNIVRLLPITTFLAYPSPHSNSVGLMILQCHCLLLKWDRSIQTLVTYQDQTLQYPTKIRQISVT